MMNSESNRRFGRFVEAVLNGRRGRPFAATDDEAAQIRTAVTLRAARPASGAPSEEFVAALHRRLAAEMTGEPSRTRRRVVQVTSVAAASTALGVAAGVVVERELGRPEPGTADRRVRPNTGTWHTVASTASMPEGAVVGFDVGSVNGFVHRANGRLVAVSGVCTHLGCRLALDSPTRELTCPCHRTAFAPSGEVVRYQLPVPPPTLPRLAVRETDGTVQVFAP
jgi:cytochrome b6-f complex iron-sulfur subunit